MKSKVFFLIFVAFIFSIIMGLLLTKSEPTYASCDDAMAVKEDMRGDGPLRHPGFGHQFKHINAEIKRLCG